MGNLKDCTAIQESHSGGAARGSNLSEAQAELLVSKFETATFLLDPDEAGQKLKQQLVYKLLPKLTIRVIKPHKQADLMTAEELRVILGLKAA